MAADPVRYIGASSIPMDWADLEAERVSHSLPLVDFASRVAQEAFATAIRSAHAAGRREGLEKAARHVKVATNLEEALARLEYCLAGASQGEGGEP